MIINLTDTEMMLSYIEEMVYYGYNYVAFNTEEITEINKIKFFRYQLDAKEYCLAKINDAEYFQHVPIGEIISDLKAVLKSELENSKNEAIKVTGFSKRERDGKEFLENNLNTNTMNQKNLDYLKDQLKYTGFGETFDTELKEHMLKGDKEFKIAHNGVYGKDTMSVELNFKKSDQSDMYFFNSYHVNLKKEESKEGLEQTFYINNDSTSITLKEAYNLMEGRSVNKDLKTKEGEAYNAWIKIDFKNTDSNGAFKLNQFHQNYGYDLEASLAKHSIKELETPKYKEDLINSLKKGNLQSVTFTVKGTESKMFVEANPQFKTLNVYDGSLQRINHRESKEEKKSQNEETSEKQSDKKQNETVENNDETPTANKKKRKQQSNSV
ncbi:hypothetical protein [Flavobacterium sp. F52]|uniref:hypothetical protein n=1 Tax=Flavobacterium sp. F52 TaxID=1202532 RepID=UPI000272D4F7|nr:hypothetical protein [Flavobacterium sp. F52]EJG03144.1 hypothetical protein FF52_03090 [Flavobacterium sp. F52]